MMETTAYNVIPFDDPMRLFMQRVVEAREKTTKEYPEFSGTEYLSALSYLIHDHV